MAEYLELNSAHQVRAYYPWSTQEALLSTVQLNVYQLIAREDRRLLADIGWRLTDSQGVVISGRYQASLDWQPHDFSTYVAEMNQAIEGLADELIHALSASSAKKQ